MPGVNSVVVRRVPVENGISFRGFEERISMHGIDKDESVCRTYVGNLVFDVVRFPEIVFDFKLVNGVLWIQVRCDEITDEDAATRADLGVTLRTQQSETGITNVSAINPLLSAGLDRYSYHGFNKEAFIFAVDMPGIGELDFLRLTTTENTINIYAQDSTTEGSYGEGDDEAKREYDCYFRVNLQEFDPTQTEYEMVHGVLWIRVPRRVKPRVELVTLFHGAREQEKVYNQ